MNPFNSLQLLILSAVPFAYPLAIAKAADATELQLATQAVGILTTYCHRCHGVDFKKPGLDVLDRASLVAAPKDGDEVPMVVPGKPEASRIWQVLGESYMPPEKQRQPTPAEKETIRQWILAGAPFPESTRSTRPYRGEGTVLTAIRGDLEKLSTAQRRFTRYFSLVHLWNDQRLGDADLRDVRAAVSKLANSLSKQFRIAAPRAIDADGTVLAIDLRDYGWDDGNQWERLLMRYPYGLSRNEPELQDVYRWTDCALPYVRADWFVHAASRPPLYHQLLALPNHAEVLETELGVNVKANYANDRLWRAAFRQSGVSSQNRLVERHDAKYGAYWKSYDFLSNLDRGDLFRFPLGPQVDDAANRAAFHHDGGEVIFNLPNGLQGYLLAKGDDTRIDEGPIKVVKDANEFAGSPAIVNGISCMGCHKHGMIEFTDGVRAAYQNLGAQPNAQKVLALYPKKEEMDRLVQGDKDRFLGALERAIGPFVRTGPDDARKITEFPEPITKVARLYDRSLVLDQLSCELLLPDDQATAEKMGTIHRAELATAIKVSNTLRQLGLAALVTGQPLARESWEEQYHDAARELKLGVPIKVR